VRSIAQATGAGLDQVRQDERLPQALARFDHHYQTCLGTRSVLYPGVRETLTALRERGCRMAVVTNKESRHTDRLIEALELRSFFERVVSGDTFPTRKPDPVGVLACLEAWRIDPQQGLFVGDSAIDAQTARRAGLPVFLLTYGYNMGRDVRESQPDRVLDHFAQILQALGPPALS
jgi:phosphoglycolate phosphatase